MRRKLNVKFLFLLGALLVATSGGVALAHHLQSKRITLALLRQSQRAEEEKRGRKTSCVGRGVRCPKAPRSTS